MLSPKFFTLIFILTGFLSKAQSGDSLVKFSDLTFKSNFEKAVFKNFQSSGSKTDVIDLFLTPFSKAEGVTSKSVHDQINECVEYLKKETEKQSDEKKVKTIYKYVHKRFFKVYKLKNSFSDIFEKGEYNCVSGSAMYGIVFTLMNIPFQVIEAPQHVFLVAYPDSYKILIETTSPQDGYFVFSNAYIERYIKYLNEAKLISDEEYKNTNANDLFKKYYFVKKGLNLIELAGAQYCNYAVYNTDDNNNDKALDEIKKAYYLWTGERHKYLLEWLLSNTVANNDYKKQEDVTRLSILCRFNSLDKKEVSDEKIKYEFRRIMQTQLIDNSDYLMVEKSFNLIYANLKDSAIKNEISFDYHYEMARIGYNTFKDKTYEFPHLKEAYKIKPKHADLQSIIKSYFGKIVEKTEEPATILKQIKEFSDEFDFINKSPEFNSTRANCFLELAYQSFILNDPKKGDAYLSDFETLHGSNESVKPSERFIEKAYSTAAGYYYKKGNVSKTKQVLKTGIQYAPKNFGLKVRLDQLH